MVLAIEAWQRRQRAREALMRGDLARARRLVGEAQALHRTRRGASLQLLATWLAAPLRRPGAAEDGGGTAHTP
jgi:hypothetical protein